MNATQLPDLAFFQWSTPSNPKPTLAQPIGKTDTTLRFSAPPLDYNGDVIAKDFIMGIRHPNGYIESVYVPAADLSTDGLVAENCVRGIDLEGLDYNTGDASLTYSFDQDTPVFCNITGVMQSIMSGVILGTLSTGGTVFKVGKGADDDVYYYAQNADANKPYIRYNKTQNKWYISNDGVNDIDIASGGVSTASNGITIVAGDIQLDLTDTTAFKDARTGNETIVPVTKAADGKLDKTFMPQYVEDLINSGTTVSEIDQALNGISANVTKDNLNTLTAGVSSNADSLHTHSFPKVLYRKTVQSVASTSSSISQDITIPANSMGANGILRIKIDSYIDITSSTGTITVTFGGTTVFSQATSASSAVLGEILIFNVNNTSLQNKAGQVLIPGLSPTDIYPVNTAGASFATVDTTSNVTLNITLSGSNSNKYLNFVSVELL